MMISSVFPILLVLVMVVLTAAAAAQRRSLRTDFTLCDKYAAINYGSASLENEVTLIQLIVNRAAMGSIAVPEPTPKVDVPGVLTPNTFTIGTNTLPVRLFKYFDGSQGAINEGGVRNNTVVLDGSTNQEEHLSHLYQYFGHLFGCTASGYPSYEGDFSMYEVHKFMALNPYEVGYFIEQFALSVRSIGATASEALQVKNFFTFFFGYNCLPPAKIIHDPYSTKQSVCTTYDCPLLKGKSACALYEPQLVETM